MRKLTMLLDMKTIETMVAAGIELSVNVRDVCGGYTFTLSPKDVPVFIADKDECAANHYGVSKAQYLEWLEHGGRPRCSGLTTKRRRCQNYLSGPIQLGIHEWLRCDGGYCVLHGGATSAEARR
jgi:hypothetical protein